MSRAYYRMLSNLYHAAHNIDQAYVNTARSRNLKANPYKGGLMPKQKENGDVSTARTSVGLSTKRKRSSNTIMSSIRSKRSLKLHRRISLKATNQSKRGLKSGRSGQRILVMTADEAMARILAEQRKQAQQKNNPPCCTRFDLSQRIFKQFVKSAENLSRYTKHPFRDLQPGVEQWRSKLVYEKMAMDDRKAYDCGLNSRVFTSCRESMDTRKRASASFTPSFCERMKKSAF